MLNIRGTSSAGRCRKSEMMPLPSVHIYLIKNICFLCSRVSTPKRANPFFLVGTASLLTQVFELLSGFFLNKLCNGEFLQYAGGKIHILPYIA